MNFIRFLREILTGIFGIVGDLSTIVFVLTFFVPGLESFRPVLFIAIAVGFIGSAFKIYTRQQSALNERATQHARELTRLRAEIDELKRPSFTAETRQVAETAYRELVIRPDAEGGPSSSAGRGGHDGPTGAELPAFKEHGDELRQHL